MPTAAVQPPTLMELRAIASLRPLKRNQQLTPITNIPASTQPENTAWQNLCMATGENTTAQKLSITLRI